MDCHTDQCVLEDWQQELVESGVTAWVGMSSGMHKFLYVPELTNVYYVRNGCVQRLEDVRPSEDVEAVVDHHSRWLDTGVGPEYPVRIVESVGIED